MPDFHFYLDFGQFQYKNRHDELLADVVSAITIFHEARLPSKPTVYDTNTFRDGPAGTHPNGHIQAKADDVDNPR